MTIALGITLSLLIFILYLRTQGHLVYFSRGELVRGDDGHLLTVPQFYWKLENGFLCRLAGFNSDSNGDILPVYLPVFSLSWGEGMLIVEFGRLVIVFEKALPFVHLVWDTGERQPRHVSDE